MRALVLALALFTTAPIVLVGCGEPAVKVMSRQVTVACGTCIFRLPNGRGCYWAAEIDGKYYPVTGNVPKDHENHSPEGMCNMKRTAIVDGEISGTTFIATRFELQPAEAPAVDPTYTEDDAHDGSWDVSKAKP
ncbi:MAG: hypothetical protein EP330_24100 [Deltaproteobacteria bacterium]|nr:MAG: hypothetical protein EP330_24100 [Deltaproteobacteria bacterium]